MPSTIGQDGPSSVSPSSPNQLSPKRKEVLERKRLTELCRLHDLIVQGFLITMSLVVRFTGFFMLPWLASAMFGISTNAIDQRALVCVLANICILLSLISHPLIYWWWNSRIRALTKEIVETLHKKLLKS
uniref:G protein-coupled receptor n=1 Tax=Globodera pallida TaxID=36090 RepID=A0A183BT23_GLOPA